ncbi:RHS repeat-associated core domain-containing protein [Chryseobacterium daecheongense]|uniref:RHS repeat domain-containing protein n=1 Tax=Chryseobacterium daecheongense TaxID=192389 RepID=UPI00206BC757|nr:RHS repeat-associated core domain-containing protein [Chryseobacterium daecheongense]
MQVQITQNDAVLRNYSYEYDALNRLKEGRFWDAMNFDRGEYFEQLTYDMNGNIKTLLRRGRQFPGYTAPEVMDDLEYHYENGELSNKLSYLKEKGTGNAQSGYPLPSGVTGSVMGYDLNGNMTTQTDKGLSVVYNYLNLPKQIVFPQGNTLYTYRADGIKIKKILGTKTTDYLDGFQYENNILKFIPTSEGYYNFENNSYIYNYTDHLGNTRLSYTKNGSGAEILEENNYYPFGLKHEGYNQLAGNPAYQYKYNGKELQETGMYDYGARFYMPEIGRWGVADDLSELQLPYSPYTYAYNNPVFFNDPTGMIPECPGGDCPKGVTDIITLPNGEKETQIQEVVVTGHKKVKSNLDLNKIAEFLAPIRPATPDETAMIDARYGKCAHNDIGCEFNIVWKQIKDIPNDLADTWENIKSIGDSEDKEEAIVSMAILMVNLKKGKTGNIAKMGNLGGKFMKLAKLLKLNINSPTTMSILENVDNTVQEFISTHRKGSIKSVFPAEHLNSTVKEALQSGNTTVRKLLTDSRFLK